MLKIDIITIFPEFFQSAFGYSIIKRAKDKQLVEINVHNLRDYATNKHKHVDDYAYGIDAGMVMSIEPMANCIEKLQEKHHYDEVIYMSPDGELLNQKMANQYSCYQSMIIICGHYKGIDERIRTYFVTKEISIGNYVLSGGELAAAVFCDSIIRLIPGVLSDETSALSDSFQDDLLAPPVYTRPAEWRGLKVPDVLLSGNHKAIKDWQQEQAIKRTKIRRPDLINNKTF